MSGAHAKPGDIQVGLLRDPIGMWRDEVYLRDLSPELQALCCEALRDLATGESLAHWKRGIADYAIAFARTVKRSEVLRR